MQSNPKKTVAGKPVKIDSNKTMRSPKATKRVRIQEKSSDGARDWRFSDSGIGFPDYW